MADEVKIFMKKALVLEEFIKTAPAAIKVKGAESIYCRYATTAHYSVMDKYQVCYDRQDALRYTLIYGKYACFTYLLSGVRYKEQLNFKYVATDKSCYTLLSLCAVNGYLAGVKHLIKDGADIHSLTVSSRGETMNLIMTICNNPHYGPAQIKCLSYLLEKGVLDPNQVNTFGQTALMFAYRINSPEMISILLKRGADKGIVDMRGLIAEDYQQN